MNSSVKWRIKIKWRIKKVKRLFRYITDFVHDAILVKKHGISLLGKAVQLDKLSVEELKEIADNINSIVIKRYCECLIEQRESNK